MTPLIIGLYVFPMTPLVAGNLLIKTLVATAMANDKICWATNKHVIIRAEQERSEN